MTLAAWHMYMQKKRRHKLHETIVSALVAANGEKKRKRTVTKNKMKTLSESTATWPTAVCAPPPPPQLPHVNLNRRRAPWFLSAAKREQVALRKASERRAKN